MMQRDKRIIGEIREIHSRVEGLGYGVGRDAQPVQELQNERARWPHAV